MLHTNGTRPTEDSAVAHLEQRDGQGIRLCRSEDKCVNKHPDAPFLPATVEYFGKGGRGVGLGVYCRECVSVRMTGVQRSLGHGIPVAAPVPATTAVPTGVEDGLLQAIRQWQQGQNKAAAEQIAKLQCDLKELRTKSLGAEQQINLAKTIVRRLSEHLSSGRIFARDNGVLVELVKMMERLGIAPETDWDMD